MVNCGKGKVGRGFGIVGLRREIYEVVKGLWFECVWN